MNTAQVQVTGNKENAVIKVEDIDLVKPRDRKVVETIKTIQKEEMRLKEQEKLKNKVTIILKNQETKKTETTTEEKQIPGTEITIEEDQIPEEETKENSELKESEKTPKQNELINSDSEDSLESEEKSGSFVIDLSHMKTQKQEESPTINENPCIEISTKTDEIANKELFDNLIKEQTLKATILKENLLILNTAWSKTKDRILPFFEDKYAKLKKEFNSLNETSKKQSNVYNDRQKQLGELFKAHEHIPFDSNVKASFSRVVRIDTMEIEKNEKEMSEKQCGYDRIKTLNDVYWKSFNWRLVECENTLNITGYDLGLKNYTIIGGYTDKNTSSTENKIENPIKKDELEGNLDTLIKEIILLKEEVRLEVEACSIYSRSQKEHIDESYKKYYEKYTWLNDTYIETKEKIFSKLLELDKTYQENENNKIPSSIQGTELEKKLDECSMTRKETDTLRQHLMALLERTDKRMVDLYNSVNKLHIIIENKYVAPYLQIFFTPIQPLPGKKLRESKELVSN